jgi:hypothetical protein
VAFTPWVVGLEDVEEAQGLMVESYPNPFKEKTNVFITMVDQGQVKATILDLMGRVVAVLHSGQLPEGRHDISFEPDAGLNSGIYYLHVQAGNHSQVKVMSYIKQH